MREFIYYCEEENEFKIFDEQLHNTIKLMGGPRVVFFENVVYVGEL